MGGRPCALTPEVSEALVEATAAGMPDWRAAEEVGVGRRTFYEWIRRGRETGREPYASFAHAVREARARAEARRREARARERARRRRRRSGRG